MKRRTKLFVYTLLASVLLTLAILILAMCPASKTDTLTIGNSSLANAASGLFNRPPDGRNLPSHSPYFVDVAEEMGLTDVLATEICWVDANSDGYWDVYLEREHLYLSQSGKSFVEFETGFEFPDVTRVVPIHQQPVDLSNVKRHRLLPTYVYFADLNNDGHADAIHGIRSDWQFNHGSGWKTINECDHGYRNSIYFGNGSGRFKKQTPIHASFNDPSLFGPTFALAIADYDNDGCLNVFEGQNYRRYGIISNCGQDQLWFGDGMGGFKNMTVAAGLITTSRPRTTDSARPTYGATHGDINNDGFQDILQLAYGRQWNMHWRNRGGRQFDNVAPDDHFGGDDCRHGRYPEWWIDDKEKSLRRPYQPELPFRSNGNTMDAAIADYDNDGDLDIFLGEIKHEWAGPSSDLSSLLVNRGAEGNYIFDRIPVDGFLPLRESLTHDLRKINFGDLHSAWLDFDNDGWLDLLIALETTTMVNFFDFIGSCRINDLSKQRNLPVLTGKDVEDCRSVTTIVTAIWTFWSGGLFPDFPTSIERNACQG